ncbi:hypothetical protein V1499_06955 [Neobacillus sp. SCS-31]|uniref:hypothetical protein n=1 Tax=Neobacillus oceani TaxID=3115292 RepID=UPI003906C3D8
MNIGKLEMALKSIGKRSFVDDYEIYNNKQLSKTKKIEMLSEIYTSNGATIRVSFAEDTFEHGKQKEALLLIMDSPRLSAEVKEKAKNLLRLE